MILLDTDHLSILQFEGNERRRRVLERMVLSIDQVFGCTIISIEEQMRGWLAAIAKERTVHRQISPYLELERLFAFFSRFLVASFDRPAADRFEQLRHTKVKVATMDLRIASIALATNSLLLTGNRKDFQNVPGLRFENWMD